MAQPSSVRATFQTLRHLPAAPGLSASVFALGLGSSFAVPYLPLFGVQVAHMTPLRLGIFLTCVSLCSIILSTLLGRWSDKLPSRRPVVLLGLGSAVCAYLMLSVTRQYWLLLVLGGVLLGTGASSFPQLFAYARVQFASAAGDTIQHGLTSLRSIFSLAWVVGPLIGAALLGAFSFGGLFVFSALAYGLAALPVLLDTPRRRRKRPRPPPPQTPHSEPHGNPVTARQLQLIALAFALYSTALSMGASALPLFVTQTLHGSSGQVGWLIGLCALIEIPMMLSFVLRPTRLSPASMMVAAFGLLAAYLLMVAFSGNIFWLSLSQVPRAGAIAISACLGMAYFQDLMPGRVGAATTLFANTSNAGNVLAGTLFGVWAQAFGYHSVFGLCVALSALACALMLYVRHGRPGQALLKS
ncbi:sugar efflux transporter [Deinococcus sp.]|uniref:sugar efflux transporter n=1 Tax=Deinococcus sp. TaxID=47478 RepID=UPI003B5A0A08